MDSKTDEIIFFCLMLSPDRSDYFAKQKRYETQLGAILVIMKTNQVKKSGGLLD
jgi:hypothetical protein